MKQKDYLRGTRILDGRGIRKQHNPKGSKGYKKALTKVELENIELKRRQDAVRAREHPPQ